MRSETRAPLIATLVLVAACAAHAPTPEMAGATSSKRVAYLTDSIADPFTSRMATMLSRRALMLGINVTTVSAPSDADSLHRHLDDAIEARYDLIAITLAPHLDAALPLARAQRAGIPVVLVHTQLGPEMEAQFATFVGEDQSELGAVAGATLQRALSGNARPNANVAVIANALDQPGTARLLEGFTDALAAHSSIALVAVEDAHGDPAAAGEITRDLLQRFASAGGLHGIFAATDALASAVIVAAESMGVATGPDGLIVVGGRCSLSGIEMIKAGRQFATASQIPARTGWEAAEVMARYFNGETLPKSEFLPVLAIEQDGAAMWESACTY